MEMGINILSGGLKPRDDDPAACVRLVQHRDEKETRSYDGWAAAREGRSGAAGRDVAY
jgi:hypothetical protein